MATVKNLSIQNMMDPNFENWRSNKPRKIKRIEEINSLTDDYKIQSTTYKDALNKPIKTNKEVGIFSILQGPS